LYLTSDALMMHYRNWTLGHTPTWCNGGCHDGCAVRNA